MELQAMGQSADDADVLLSTLFGSSASVKEADSDFSHRMEAFKATCSVPASQKRQVKEEDEEEEEEQHKGVAVAKQKDEDAMIDEQQQQQRQQQQQGIRQKKGYLKKQREASSFSNHLMLAEPMTDIPDYMEEEWIAVPVPQGTRCLVISQNDTTVARDPDGNVLDLFKSTLPYGSPATRENGGNFSSRYCILDCLYDDTRQVYYVLEVLVWKGMLYFDCDKEFRLFWRDSKLQETTSAKQSPSNPYPFITLPSYSKFTTEFILFYHKDSHYDFGLSPLFLSMSYTFLGDLVTRLQDRASS
eukprot:gene3837-4429_t